MAIDGTWRRDCQLNSISDTDAVLTVEGSIQGLNLKEFFLLLSSTGLAYRRCELVRVNGTEMDIHFLRGKHAKKRPGASAKADERWPEASVQRGRAPRLHISDVAVVPAQQPAYLTRTCIVRGSCCRARHRASPSQWRNRGPVPWYAGRQAAIATDGRWREEARERSCRWPEHRTRRRR